jgi:hypothetical protein
MRCAHRATEAFGHWYCNAERVPAHLEPRALRIDCRCDTDREVWDAPVASCRLVYRVRRAPTPAAAVSEPQEDARRQHLEMLRLHDPLLAYIYEVLVANAPFLNRTHADLSEVRDWYAEQPVAVECRRKRRIANDRTAG